ncbi:MAG: hypothetical protein ACYTGQ_12075 [Planctomycetota bacterium]|jgi:hypothetical protein
MSGKHKTAAEAQSAIERRNKVVLVVLIAVLGVCVLRVAMKRGGPETAKAVAEAPASVATSANPKAEPAKKVIELDVPVDAFARLFELALLPVEATTQAGAAVVEVKPTISTEGLKLGSTIVSGQASIAIINGQLYRLGQSVNGMTVTQIEQRAVHLSAEGQTAVLRIDNE